MFAVEKSRNPLHDGDGWNSLTDISDNMEKPDSQNKQLSQAIETSFYSRRQHCLCGFKK